MLCNHCGKPTTLYSHAGCSPDAEWQDEYDQADDPGRDIPDHL